MIKSLSYGILYGLLLNPWFIGILIVNLSGIIYVYKKGNIK